MEKREPPASIEAYSSVHLAPGPQQINAVTLIASISGIDCQSRIGYNRTTCPRTCEEVLALAAGLLSAVGKALAGNRGHGAAAARFRVKCVSILSRTPHPLPRYTSNRPEEESHPW
jgi:hypothetical protein